MLVDDSLVARSIVERILGDAGGFSIVASVPSAADAIAYLDQGCADLILLDIEMPGMSGLDALPLLLEKGRGARVLILSANCPTDGTAAVQALMLGAADTLLKPGRGAFAGSFASVLVDRLRALARSVNQRTAVKQDDPPTRTRQEISERRAMAVIGIGGSTGGIVAINAVLTAMPDNVQMPIFITQHLPASFIEFFAAQLRRVIDRPVHVAIEDMMVEPGAVYLAPGDAHLTVTASAGAYRITLDRSISPSRAMPSVDLMLASLAEQFGQRCLAVILSGMGRDGSIGAQAVRHQGGLVIAQDSASSVVWGMPGAVVRDGVAHAIMTPAQVGDQLGRHPSLFGVDR